MQHHSLVPTRCVGTSCATWERIPGAPRQVTNEAKTNGTQPLPYLRRKGPTFPDLHRIELDALFTRPQTVNIILEALRHRQEQNGWRVYGYVILENHLHLIVQAENLLVELPRFKSYTARKLIDCLKECHAEHLLRQLAFFRKQHKHDRDYQLWEEGSHPQIIENAQVMRQKLEYIHQNPVKRGYVDDPTHWRYSSAGNYVGLPGLIPVFMDWF